MTRAAKSMTVKIGLLGLAEVLLLGALWYGVNRQMTGMNQAVNDISDLKDPSPFRAALMGYLGKIHLGLQGYLRSPDASLLDQVGQSRKDFEASLPEFQKQNPKLFPKAAVEEIRRNFTVYSEAIDHTLEAHARRMKVRIQLDQNFARMIQVIDHNIKPLIRGDQAESDERKGAILNVENQALAWQQNLAKAWSQPTLTSPEVTYENDNRGSSYLERYARMELLTQEKKLVKELKALWQSNSDIARESFAMEKVVNESQSFMDAQQAQVVVALNRFLPAMAPTELEQRKQGFVRGIRMHGAAACLFGMVAVASLAALLIGAYRVKRGVPIWTYHRPAKSKEEAGEAKGKQPDLTLQMDLRGVISAWSKAAEKLYGYSADEMRGQSVGRLFESEEEITRLYKDLLNSPNAVFETTHKNKSGTFFRVKIEFRPLSDASDKPSGIGLVCTHR